MSGYCDAQAHGQPLCSVQCAQCIGEEGLDALRAENARLREALETVASIHERHNHCSQVERVQQAYDMRCVARAALTGGPHE